MKKFLIGVFVAAVCLASAQDVKRVYALQIRKGDPQYVYALLRGTLTFNDSPEISQNPFLGGGFGNGWGGSNLGNGFGRRGG